MIEPNKDLGQNFLRSDKVIDNFIQEVSISDGDIIYEIGPGEGVITAKILQKSEKFKLTSIDIDERSIEILQSFKDVRFNFLHKDILKFLPEIKDSNYKIIGAIPYNITSPIIHKILEKENLPKKIVFIVQKEVGEKICHEKKMSYMSLYISYFYQTKYISTISRFDFYPSPKVDSALIVLNLKDNIQKIEKVKFSNFLHKTFRSPRKKINKVFPKEMLIKNKISPDLRPEDLNLEQVLILFNEEN